MNVQEDLSCLTNGYPRRGDWDEVANTIRRASNKTKRTTTQSKSLPSSSSRTPATPVPPLPPPDDPSDFAALLLLRSVSYPPWNFVGRLLRFTCGCTTTPHPSSWTTSYDAQRPNAWRPSGPS